MDVEHGVRVLAERPAEDFEPTEEEVKNYAEWLGLDPKEDADLMHLAREGLKAPLSEGWKPCTNAENEIFYFNFQTGATSWTHPADEEYRNKAQQQVVIVEESWSPRRIEFVGIMLVLGSICFNCLGALLVENFLKAKGELYEQKAQLLLGEVVVNSILVFVGPLFITDLEVRAMNSPWQRGFFSGWDGRVLVCAILWIPAGWTATMLVKRCSNLLKTLAQAFSSVLTYVFSVVPLSSGPRTWAHFVTMLGPPLTPEPVSSPVVLLAISVMISALTFGADRREPKISNRRHTDHQEVPEKWKVDSSYLQVRPRSRQISESSGR